MTDGWLALLGHLQHAAESYGEDLPLPGVGQGPLIPRQPPAPQPGDRRPASDTAVIDGPRPRKHGAPASRRSPPGRSDPPPGPAKGLRPAAGQSEVLPCTRCKLRQAATQVVFGEGSPTARVMFVGEAPGQVEDQQGRPFVGRSGKLLDKIIENAMGLRREDVFIANINKCQPPGNRDPEPLEIASCLPWLRSQIQIISPDVIVTLGRVAMWNLLGITDGMGRMRGRQLEYEGIPVVPTWHPAYLLRNPAAKSETWADIKRVNRLLGNPEVPTRQETDAP